MKRSDVSFPYFAIVFLHGEPALGDEVEEFIGLEISNDDRFEKPRGRRIPTGVVVPKMEMVQ